MESRMRRFIGYMYRYIAPPSQVAVRDYQAVADLISLPLAPLALAFVYSRPFVTSTILGATTVQQLRDNVMALNLAPLSEDVVQLINDVYKKHRDPSKVAYYSCLKIYTVCMYVCMYVFHVLKHYLTLTIAESLYVCIHLLGVLRGYRPQPGVHRPSEASVGSQGPRRRSRAGCHHQPAATVDANGIAYIHTYIYSNMHIA